MSVAHFFWLAPLLPLAAFALLACRVVRARSALLAIGALAGALVICIAVLFAATSGERAIVAVPWLEAGTRTLTLALMLDPLSAVVAVLVSLVALVVFIYAATYMADDPRIQRFFSVMSLFVAAMMVLVFAADMIMLFIAWEMVGVCSYLLIGFWFERPGVPAAATQALMVTRVADIALLAGIVLLLKAAGTLRIDAILPAVESAKIDESVLPLIAALLFVGAAGKSAQVPFHGWLPDAMVGPTPVSALLHSATMVAAGVFLVARLYPIFLAAPAVLQAVAWIGVVTALAGGFAALVQTDLKRLLAYSTLSQLGLMFTGLGAGSLLAGVLLLLAQALYKSSLFLAAGAFERATGSRELTRMRGIARRMPLLGIAFALASAALAGLPVTLAAPPKDPVLAATLHAGSALFATTVLASVVTALYSARMFAALFLGKSSIAAQRGKPPAFGLSLPIVAVTALTLVGLLADARIVGQPLSALLGIHEQASALATRVALAVAAFGVVIGLLLYRRSLASLRVSMLGAIALRLGGYLDVRRAYCLVADAVLTSSRFAEAVERRVFARMTEGVVRRVRDAARRVATFDRRIFDASAARIARATRRFIRANERFDRRRLDNAVRSFGEGLSVASERLRGLQTGQVGNYLLVLFVGSSVVGVALAVSGLLR